MTLTFAIAIGSGLTWDETGDATSTAVSIAVLPAQLHPEHTDPHKPILLRKHLDAQFQKPPLCLF